MPYVGSSERSEVGGGAGAYAPIGSTRWYAQSIKFDPTFRTDHADLGWGAITQFHDYPSGLNSPVIYFGWPPPGSTGFTSGHWYLLQGRWSPAMSFLGYTALFEFPFNVGEWHDLKLQIKWQQDTTGTVALWYNGARQTLLTGGETFTGQTVLPSAGVDGVSPQQGYYRQDDLPTGVIYHTGFRMADSEDSL
jgi:hypothetical protein